MTLFKKTFGNLHIVGFHKFCNYNHVTSLDFSTTIFFSDVHYIAIPIAHILCLYDNDSNFIEPK
jgi:hypothetical protein